MDKDNRAKVLEAYNRYLNAVIEADIDAINECIEYPLAYVGEIQLRCLISSQLIRETGKRKLAGQQVMRLKSTW